MAKEVPKKRQWVYPNMATRWQLTQITLHENMRLHISATILQALHAGDDINSETHPCYLGLTAWCEIVFGLLLKLGSPFGESIWIYIVDYGIYKIPRNVKLVDLSKFFCATLGGQEIFPALPILSLMPLQPRPPERFGLCIWFQSTPVFCLASLNSTHIHSNPLKQSLKVQFDEGFASHNDLTRHLTPCLLLVC